MFVQTLVYAPERMVDIALGAPRSRPCRLTAACGWTVSNRRGEARPEGGRRRRPKRDADSHWTSAYQRADSLRGQPIVIAAWESAARDLGWPDRPVGWQTIQTTGDTGSKLQMEPSQHQLCCRVTGDTGRVLCGRRSYPWSDSRECHGPADARLCTGSGVYSAVLR